MGGGLGGAEEEEEPRSREAITDEYEVAQHLTRGTTGRRVRRAWHVTPRAVW